MVVDVVAVVPINQNSVWHMEKKVSGATRKKHFSKLCRSIKSNGGGTIAKHHSCYDFHEMEEKEIQFQYDTDAIEIKRTLIHFPHHCMNPARNY